MDWPVSAHRSMRLHCSYGALMRAEPIYISCSRQANVKYFTLHDLRRSSITNWAEALAVHVVQKLAGHSDIKTTQRCYFSVRASDSEKVRVFSVDILPNDLTDPLLTHSCKNKGGARQDRKMGWMQTSAGKHFTKSRPAGLEPATYGLEIRCSIQLSYERFFSKPLQYNDFNSTVNCFDLKKQPRIKTYHLLHMPLAVTTLLALQQIICSGEAEPVVAAKFVCPASTGCPPEVMK